jgi:hypothetical protein
METTYDIEITFDQGGDNEHGYDETLPTLAAAVARLERLASGSMTCRAWINNKEVKIRNGCVYDNDGQALCTNQAFHDVFAAEDYPRIRARHMRPFLTNPATIAAIEAANIAASKAEGL